jgi:glycosyltransferase involved in cell wall biosynthesis
MESMRRRLIYLVSEGLPPTVIDAQVVAVLARLAERGLVFDLFIYQLQSPRPEWNVRRRLEEIRQRLPGRVHLWPWPAQTRSVSLPGAASSANRGPIRHRRLNQVALEGAYLALQALLLAEASSSIRRGEPVVVHARGQATELALRLKRWYAGFRVVADIRGDAIAEYLYQAEQGGRSSESDDVRRAVAGLQAAERRFVREADSVQCVSDALRRRLEESAGVAPGKVRVVPCLADERRFLFDQGERDRRRQELGVGDRPVLVYSGSLLAWQNGAAMLKLFRALKGELPALHLLLLTPDRQAAAELLRREGLREGERITLRSARHDEVGSYLCAADVGLLLRDPHPLNRVASPTKFAEYALCGLPALASSGIGDLDELIRAHGLGAVLESPYDQAEAQRGLLKLVAAATAGDRAARAQRAAAIMGLGPYIDTLVREYDALSAERPDPRPRTSA